MKRSIIAAALLLTAPATAPSVAGAQTKDVWKPAATPKGGTPWTLLESTKEVSRTADMVVYSKPVFPPAVRALNGKQIKIAGWMMPLDKAAKQKRFVLLAYPPGCPFHFHAMPNQFVEVLAPAGVALNERDPLVITGTLQLTGQDESGIFYKLVGARQG
jgi:uncharacterized protein